ncbi:hypothetical protein DPEC_G00084310 [Dallia pectoralis]|uniref:Uncharacterized protein n=1 Tax=Dallia pectoralis TaxID=75939 RepID=A0ACC2GZZ7_DALPE|nr:hypothetical protein DPEC_G00084310 [Dallia pectoralis]
MGFTARALRLEACDRWCPNLRATQTSPTQRRPRVSDKGTEREGAKPGDLPPSVCSHGSNPARSPCSQHSASPLGRHPASSQEGTQTTTVCHAYPRPSWLATATAPPGLRNGTSICLNCFLLLFLAHQEEERRHVFQKERGLVGNRRSRKQSRV